MVAQMSRSLASHRPTLVGAILGVITAIGGGGGA